MVGEGGVDAAAGEAGAFVVRCERAEELIELPDELRGPVELAPQPLPGLAEPIGQRAAAGGLRGRQAGKVGGGGIEAAQQAADFAVEPDRGGLALGYEICLFDLGRAELKVADPVLGFGGNAANHS